MSELAGRRDLSSLVSRTAATETGHTVKYSQITSAERVASIRIVAAKTAASGINTSKATATDELIALALTLKLPASIVGRHMLRQGEVLC